MNAYPATNSILVCVCGGIAAYKVCQLVSRLVQQDFLVDVAMTAEATRFVGPLTFEALTARPVHLDLWKNPVSQDPQHIHLAQERRPILVAPATANMLAKMSHGLADDIVSTLLLAANPQNIIVAPAMNEMMWNNPATQRNCKLLTQAGVEFVGPGIGWQACRSVGAGRMSEPEEILTCILKKTALQPTHPTPHHEHPETP